MAAGELVGMFGRVLVVDDDPSVGKVLGALLDQAGLEVERASSAESALAILAMKPIDVVVSDVRMPGMDGLDLLARVRADYPDVTVVMLSAHATVPIAVEAMRAGAADFLLKPFDREEVVFSVRKALASAEHAQRAVPPSASASGEGGDFIGSSAAMSECYELVRKVARGSATVLLRGESGTGKELAARLIHDLGPRAGGPMVKVSCGALPETLLESELFGHERGAFTGATQRKPGRVELAQGGTLFLDEIGDVPLAMQVKLLRLVQEREYERLGGRETIRADVRFVAATHRDLDEMVDEGTFREDLFYRLNVVPIWIPALRERPEDIAPLARHFLAAFARANDKQMKLSDEALALLRAQPWPGNVRQLENFVERLVVLGDDDVIAAADVQRELGRDRGRSGARAAAGAVALVDETGMLEGRRRDAERDALREALERARGNRTVAARMLGVSRRTLYNKLAEHGLA